MVELNLQKMRQEAGVASPAPSTSDSDDDQVDPLGGAFSQPAPTIDSQDILGDLPDSLADVDGYVS